MRELLQQALEALMFKVSPRKVLKVIAAIEEELAKPEQDEPSLPPVFIGVDVTPEGTHVTAFYRKPDAVAEMFYSEFHPLAQPEQEPVAWVTRRTGDGGVVLRGYETCEPTDYDATPVYTAPPSKKKSELEKDAANLLFALRDAWPYVHGHCSIESIKKSITKLIQKHGDFADLHPQPKREWVGLTIEERLYLNDVLNLNGRFTIIHAIEAKLREKNT